MYFVLFIISTVKSGGNFEEIKRVRDRKSLESPEIGYDVRKGATSSQQKLR